MPVAQHSPQGLNSLEIQAATPVAAYLSNLKQITFSGQRAGEGYFSHDGRYMVFQSEREPNNPFYQIYLTDLKTNLTHRVSPGQGKTSCAWIHPDNKRILFASTHADPDLKKRRPRRNGNSVKIQSQSTHGTLTRPTKSMNPISMVVSSRTSPIRWAMTPRDRTRPMVSGLPLPQIARATQRH